MYMYNHTHYMYVHYKLATIANAYACSPVAGASRSVSPLTKLAIKSLVNTAKNIDNTHLCVFVNT